MPRNIPLKVVKKEPKTKTVKKAKRSGVSPYDIILGKIEINYHKIPQYISTLKKFEKESEKEARYLEAEMAKQRIKDLKNYMYEFKKEILRNYHLKEECEMENAYIKEFGAFNLFWGKKGKQLKQKIKLVKKEFVESQEKKLEEQLTKLVQNQKVKRNCITQDVLNLQKIERTLAKQKEYIKAQETRNEWQQMVKGNFARLKDKAEKYKNSISHDIEKKLAKEKEEFLKNLTKLMEDQDRTRKNELDRLTNKYEKLKKEMNSIHASEKKAVEKDLPVVINDGEIVLQGGKNKKVVQSISSKKKFLMQKLRRLDNHNYN